MGGHHRFHCAALRVGGFRRWSVQVRRLPPQRVPVRSAARGRYYRDFDRFVQHSSTIIGVPARSGKGQGAKEIGHNLARNRADCATKIVLIVQQKSNDQNLSASRGRYYSDFDSCLEFKF